MTSKIHLRFAEILMKHDQLPTVFNNGVLYIGALEGVYHGSYMMHQVLLMMNKMTQ